MAPPGLDDLSYFDRVNWLRRTDPIFQKVEIEINLACNLRCPYCFLATRKREEVLRSQRRLMHDDLFDLALSQLRDLEFAGELNYHFYAEPLLNKRLETFVSRARKALPKSKCVIYTNGDYLSAARYGKLRHAGVDLFYITRHDDRLPTHLQELQGSGDIHIELRSEMVLNNRAGLTGPPHDERVKTLPCIYPSSAIIITIEGNVLPCSCDFDERMVFGNISESHLADIWNSTEAKHFRKNLLLGNRGKYELCRDCDYYAAHADEYFETKSIVDLQLSSDH